MVIVTLCCKDRVTNDRFAGTWLLFSISGYNGGTVNQIIFVTTPEVNCITQVSCRIDL